ncbi:MAG: hypothetical protein K0S14_3383 [Thermomicrobiales bacterium]|nr:hypothetical protein [Thermomicrobiales bacterium]
MAVATPKRIRYSTPIITPEMEEAVVQALRGDPYILARKPLSGPSGSSSEPGMR